MGLKNLVIASEIIKVPGNDDLVVRGLGLDSIVYLLRHNQSALEEVFAAAQNGSLNASSVEGLAATLADRAGPLAYMLIACGCGEPEEWRNAGGLPLSVQIEAIEKIVNLTFASEGGVEKFLETVTRMLSGAADLLPHQA
jgi:hypothetical protein